MNPYKDADLRKFIESISQEVIDEITYLQEEEGEKKYQEFVDSLNVGKCFLCGNLMDSIDMLNPCFHWFTYPKGIKKKHFQSYLKEPVSFFRLDCYFRWLANTEIPITNINDLKEETSKTSYIETTIKYKNIEWAFSIGYSDKEGHSNSQSGKDPHFHLQMKVDEYIFLKFNDFHIRFIDTDLFIIKLLEKAGDLVSYEAFSGHGISVLNNKNYLEIIDEALKIVDDESTAQFRRQTIIHAEEGKKLDGALIQQAFEESNRTKEPAGRILSRLLKESSISTIISPADSIPSMVKRSGKK